MRNAYKVIWVFFVANISSIFEVVKRDGLSFDKHFKIFRRYKF